MLFLVVCLCNTAAAYQPKKGRVSASAGPYIYHGDFRSRPESFYDKPDFGFALVAEAVISKKYALEVGLFSFDKVFLREEGSAYLVEEMKRLYITTGARRWFSRYYSIGLTFFSSFSMGDSRVVDRSGPGNPDLTTLATRNTASVYGFDISNRLEFKVSKKEEIFFDLRYSYDISGGTADQANHISFGILYSREIKVD